ncbi:unnamed protein product [Phytophthora fragariaefolia]|uniref:Unnamed protein product n=1 Tax=Phytophthora fragariaefolia TaxID=1490495 RepID=A0A9W6X746_9STRA|nr:unnamed protein product [Phytophthora fragariaefolia]
MHQFMVATPGQVPAEDSDADMEGEEQNGSSDLLAERSEESINGKEMPTETAGSSDTDEDPGISVIAVSPSTNNGAPLAEWLQLLRSTVIDVAVNGHCEWLAYFATLYNEAAQMLMDDRTSALANHLAQHRTKTVKAHVSMLCWGQAHAHQGDGYACAGDNLCVGHKSYGARAGAQGNVRDDESGEGDDGLVRKPTEPQEVLTSQAAAEGTSSSSQMNLKTSRVSTSSVEQQTQWRQLETRHADRASDHWSVPPATEQEESLPDPEPRTDRESVGDAPPLR